MADPSDAATAPLLSPTDPPPYVWEQPQGQAPCVINCDHAGRHIPATLDDLGLSSAARERHIAWDIGAGALACGLAVRLNAPALLAQYSRLVVDCNRAPSEASCFAQVSDGEVIPGNQGLSAAARAARVRAIHAPYHDALADRLAAIDRAGTVPVLVAVHSFTPIMGGFSRPWHAGVLWDRDGRIAVPLLERLRAIPGLVIGDNEPYSGRHPADYTVHRHAAAAGFPHVCIEVRQDLLMTRAGIEEWSDRLADLLGSILSAGDFRRDRLPPGEPGEAGP